MTPAQTICVIAALITIGIYMVICYKLGKENRQLICVSVTAAKTVDQLAGFIDVVKNNSRDLKDNQDIQRLAANMLIEVEEHRKWRTEKCPQVDLLIQDLREMAGPHVQRKNLYATWAQHATA
jgi:hypothetical protein